MKVLFITNTLTHSKDAGIYNVIPVMLKDFYFQSIDIADTIKNSDFIEGISSHINVFEKKVNETDFSFENISEFKLRVVNVEATTFDLVIMMADDLSNLDRTNIKNNIPNALFLNDPIGINNTHSKDFLLQFSEFTPEIKMIKNISDVTNFLNIHNEIVLKPLSSSRGIGLIRVNPQYIYFMNEQIDFNIGIERIIKYINNGEKYLAMRYLNGVSEGDKRIVVVNGEVITAINRFAAKNNWLCNLNQGGIAEYDVGITENELLIINKITPILLKQGIFIYGLDTIYDEVNNIRVLSEINTSNVGGIVNNNIAKIYNEQLHSFLKDISQ